MIKVELLLEARGIQSLPRVFIRNNVGNPFLPSTKLKYANQQLRIITSPYKATSQNCELTLTLGI